MTTKTLAAETLAAAAAATAALAHTKADSKANVEIAFNRSALATFEFVVVAKGKAVDLAAVNKKAGVGYGSAAAVGFHALTGAWLHLPIDEDGDWGNDDDTEPTAQRVQSLIKKIGQPKAKAILTKKGATAQSAYAAIVKAVAALDLDIVKVLKAASKAIDAVQDARLAGADLPDDAQQYIDSISLALHNIVLGATPVVVEIVKEKAPVAA